jgi:hypothetical protein
MDSTITAIATILLVLAKLAPTIQIGEWSLPKSKIGIL